MTKREAIGQIRIYAEQDSGISDGALRLLFRICSYRFTDPKATMEKSFPVTWAMAATWCFIKDADAAARRINELVDRGYLKRDGVRGCPPKRYFFLSVNYRSRGVIDCRHGGVNNYRQGGAHHISNSFQEEKIKGKREEIKSSLRSSGTNGDLRAALPERVKLTPAQLAAGLQGLSRMRSDLEPKTKTGAAFEKKT